MCLHACLNLCVSVSMCVACVSVPVFMGVGESMYV